MICVSPPQLTVIVTSRLRSPRDCDEVAKSESREHPKRNIKTSFILRLLCSNICEFALLLLLNQLEFPHDQSPVCFWCCYAIRRLGYIASVFCVSLPGKHISLVICVRGHTYHGETHIPVTPVFRDLGTPVKRNKKQLSDYMTMQQKATFRLHDKLKIFHVILFNRKKIGFRTNLLTCKLSISLFK